MKQELWGGEFRTDGYYVATVGERWNWNKVEDYVVKQGKPREELRQFGFVLMFDVPWSCHGVIHSATV